MSDKMRNYNQEMTNIMNAMADSTLAMTDEEIEAEIKDEGGTPDAVSERVRDIMREAIKSCQQRSLLDAQKRYDERIEAMKVKKYQIPDLLRDQREMIVTLLASNPHLGAGLLTAQFRDFKELPDEDVGSCLRQLLELIEIPDLTGSEEDKQ